MPSHSPLRISRIILDDATPQQIHNLRLILRVRDIHNWYNEFQLAPPKIVKRVHRVEVVLELTSDRVDELLEIPVSGGVLDESVELCAKGLDVRT